MVIHGNYYVPAYYKALSHTLFRVWITCSNNPPDTEDAIFEQHRLKAVCGRVEHHISFPQS